MAHRIPVLTYHGVHVDGSDYETNDHIGLRCDLELIHKLGWKVARLTDVIGSLLSGKISSIFTKTLCLTFDDGSWFDWHDLPHPHYGTQRSFANILRDFIGSYGGQAQPNLHATSFVITSPYARSVLDKTCMIGKGWWGDEWWKEAHNEGLIGIANHSWDHRHHTLPKEIRYGEKYGDFKIMQDVAECNWQVRQAQEYLQRLLGRSPEPFFAYPYGDVPAVLAQEYFPAYHEDLGLIAAFSSEPAPIAENADPWRLPRFVFRRDWNQPHDLQALLREICR